MADWLAPFHMPKFTDEDFERRKSAYTDKHGFTVSVPSLGDIVHLKPFNPLNKTETSNWKKRRYDTFSPKRLLEISKYKADRKRRYLQMLASPSPKIVRSAGAILTALDDLQDAVSTIACIGLIAATVIGGTTAAILTGPLGWIVGASTVLSLINPYSYLRGRKGSRRTGRGQKSMIEKLTDKNPFSKKSRLKVAQRIKKFRPTIGNAIEALQTTDQVFGIGLSIGPIMGFAQDAIAGTVRKIGGQKVSVSIPKIEIPDYAKQARRALSAAAVMNSYLWKTELDDLTHLYVGLNLSLQALSAYNDDFNPMEEIEDLDSYEIQAPKITDILIQEIILESGHTIEEYEVWPQNGKEWISYVDLFDGTAQNATDNLNYFGNKYKNSNQAFVAANNAHDFGLGILEAFEGPGQVVQEWSHAERTTLIIMDNGWVYPLDITEPQVKLFEDWVYVHEYIDTQPTGREIWDYAERFCGFTWGTSEDEFR